MFKSCVREGDRIIPSVILSCDDGGSVGNHQLSPRSALALCVTGRVTHVTFHSGSWVTSMALHWLLSVGNHDKFIAIGLSAPFTSKKDGIWKGFQSINIFRVGYQREMKLCIFIWDTNGNILLCPRKDNHSNHSEIAFVNMVCIVS